MWLPTRLKTNTCSCRSKGKHCSPLCRYCKGLNCSNKSTELIKDDFEENAQDEQEETEYNNDINTDETCGSSDNFESDTTFNDFSESESDFLNYSMDEYNVEIKEDIYASDDAIEHASLNVTYRLKRKKFNP